MSSARSGPRSTRGRPPAANWCSTGGPTTRRWRPTSRSTPGEFDTTRGAVVALVATFLVVTGAVFGGILVFRWSRAPHALPRRTPSFRSEPGAPIVIPVARHGGTASRARGRARGSVQTCRSCDQRVESPRSARPRSTRASRSWWRTTGRVIGPARRARRLRQHGVRRHRTAATPVRNIDQLVEVIRSSPHRPGTFMSCAESSTGTTCGSSTNIRAARSHFRVPPGCGAGTWCSASS